jgi:prolyl 4-hydroxylase
MNDNFIGQYFLDDLSICDDLIKFFNENKSKHHNGLSGNNYDPSVKLSTDMPINVEDFKNKCIRNYMLDLQKATVKYYEQYPYCNSYARWAVDESFNIQHYKPNEGYFAWHTERGSIQHPIGNRHLVFTTYLNDVTDEGETEFFHQKLKIQPKKGLTVIWPADWTHTHRGIPSKTQEKYIITGWYSFLN